MACYSGPNPYDSPEDRMAIWKWAKANGVDRGLPLNEIHDAINQYFYAGNARPEWINDILAGRKTPLRNVADAVWKAQYNRRVITQQAKDLVTAQTGGTSRILKGLERVLALPREALVFGHGVVFPVTHAGDLAFRPQSWGTFFGGLKDSYTKAWSKGATERLLDGMKRKPLFDTALRSGLDVGEKSRAVGFFNPNAKEPASWNLLGRMAKMSREQSERAWSTLTVLRYNLWDHEMQNWMGKNAGATQEEILDVGKNLADWANHATGSAKKSIPYGNTLLFGPKLTASKLARVIADPIKTVNTFANWKSASVGERAVAKTRLNGLVQYAGTLGAFLAVNQGLISALGGKQQINFNDPTKSDWLKFKLGGLELGMPGLHTEIRTLGQILAASWISNKEARGSRAGYLADVAGKYLLAKAAPGISLGKELLTGEAFPNRPLPVPWAPQPSPKAKKPPVPYTWPEYLGQHGPIFLQGPIKYTYDHFRGQGASAKDSFDLVKALIIGGLGATGLHVQEEPAPKETIKRAHVAHQLLRR